MPKKGKQPQRRRFPISELPKKAYIKPKEEQFDNGGFGDELDGDDAIAGIVAFTDQQRQWIAGALHYIARKWPMDSNFIKFDEAQALYDGALQIMRLMPLLLRRKPPEDYPGGLDDYREIWKLQASFDGGKSFVDTDYDLSNIPLYRWNPGQVKSSSGTIIGAFSLLGQSYPQTGEISQSWNLTINDAYLGVKGDPGDDGQDGHDLLGMSLNLLEWYRLADSGIRVNPGDDRYLILDIPTPHLVDLDKVVLNILSNTSQGFARWIPTPRPPTEIDPRYFALELNIPDIGQKGDKGDDGIIITDALGIAVSPGGLAYADLVDHPSVSGTKRLVIGVPIGAQGDQGDKGDPGDTGEAGHGIDFTDPPVQVENPNVDPYFELDNALPSKTFAKVHLPRAQKITTLPTITGAAGSSASTAYSLDTNGDLVMQHTIPRGNTGATGAKGDKGDPGENGLALDDTPPARGQTKEYTQMIDAYGTFIPFVLTPDHVLRVQDSHGYWLSEDGADSLYVQTGLGHPTATLSSHPVGTVKATAIPLSVGGVSETLWPVQGDVTPYEDSYVLLASNSFLGGPARGQVAVKYTVENSAPDFYVQANVAAGGTLTVEPYQDQWQMEWTGGFGYAPMTVLFLTVAGGLYTPVTLSNIQVLQYAGLNTDTDYWIDANGTQHTRQSGSAPDSFYEQRLVGFRVCAQVGFKMRFKLQ